MAWYLNLIVLVSYSHTVIILDWHRKCKTDVCIFTSAFSSAMGRLGQTWGWGTIVCTVKTVTLTMKVNSEPEIFVGEKGREGLKSSLLISLISTIFLLAFYHHTVSFLNGDFSFLFFKDHFLSVFHSFIWCIFRFEIQQSLELRANQFNTHKIHWQEGFKLVVRNKAVSNSTNSSGKIVFKII